MKPYYLVLIILPIFAAKILNCNDNLLFQKSRNIQKKCENSDYSKYVECLHQERRKREACCEDEDSDCSNNCNDCDCQECSSGGCSDNCNSCCGTSQHSCETHYCCYKTCHAQCSNANCRRSCRKSCNESVDKHTSSSKHDTRSNTTAEIRTILHVINEINNTNEINIPVDVNSTSFNNITVLTSQMESMGMQSFYPQYVPNVPTYPQQTPSQPIQRPQVPCCTVATPSQCVPQATNPYVSCYYQTQQVCSNVCQSHNVVHPYMRQVCDDNMAMPCQNQMVYSPQQRPMCAFGSSWPYFGCGVPEYRCSGCYESQFDMTQCPDYCNMMY